MYKILSQCLSPCQNLSRLAPYNMYKVELVLFAAASQPSGEAQTSHNNVAFQAAGFRRTVRFGQLRT